MRFEMAQPFFPEEEIAWILAEYEKILRGEAFLSMHKQVQAFEREFAAYCGAKFGVGTNSCSAALEIALRSIGIQAGDEVIVPAETFIATGAAVVREGATPVFAEVNPTTFCLDLESVQEKLSPKTKAVILVHMAGMIAQDALVLRDFCEQRGLFLIEDAAHAHGASLDGRKAGSLGHIACFSFFPTKMMTTGEGGMLLTSDPELYARANSYRNRGLDLSSKQEQYSGLGTNNRMSELAAILGRSQLRCLEGFVAARNRTASIYTAAIQAAGVEAWIRPLVPACGVRSAYWRYLAVLGPGLNRETLRERMQAEGIRLDWAYYPPLHQQPVFKALFAGRGIRLPRTEALLEKNICLPMHARLSEADAALIVGTLLKHIKHLSEAASYEKNCHPSTSVPALDPVL